MKLSRLPSSFLNEIRNINNAEVEGYVWSIEMVYYL
jgi:hypothetical protein